MNKQLAIVLSVAAAAMIALTGCEKKSFQVEVPATSTPTPAPVATSTPTPMPTSTPTPIPTPSPSPRMIGKKNAASRSVLLTNNLSDGLRQLFVRVSGSGEWGENLIPKENYIHVAEQVSMNYTPVVGEDGPVDYDLRIYTKEWDAYEIYHIKFSDMDAARLVINDDGYAKLLYMSLADGTEVSTDSSYDYEDDYSDYDDDYYEDYNDYDEDDYSDYDDDYYEDYNEDYNEDDYSDYDEDDYDYDGDYDYELGDDDYEEEYYEN